MRTWLRDVLRPYEPDVCATLAQLVKPGMTVADVGANRGYFTLRLARLVGRRGRVVVVEAHPDNAKLIRQRVRRRGFGGRVQVVNAAADAVAGTVELFPGRGRNPGEWSIDAVFASRTGENSEPIRVPAVALDECLPDPSVVKIDVEGAEDRVVAGMSRLLTDVRPIVVLERHGEAGIRAMRQLVDAGYRLETTDGGEANETTFHVVCLPPR